MRLPLKPACERVGEGRKGLAPLTLETDVRGRHPMLRALDVLSRRERLEQARADGRELRSRRAHDDRDDVAAVGRLRLDQPASAVDAEVDAVAGHPELQPPGGERPVLPP